jgi:hypothetical protein
MPSLRRQFARVVALATVLASGALSLPVSAADLTVDTLTEDALAIGDDARREAMLQRATELAINDTGVVPLHFRIDLWATRDGITCVPRTDESTLAWKFVPGKHQ